MAHTPKISQVLAMVGDNTESAKRLRLAIDALEMSDAEFARGAGLTPSQLANWMTGERRIGLTAALSIRSAYGLPLDWIYCGGSVEMLPSKIRSALLSKPRDTHSK